MFDVGIHLKGNTVRLDPLLEKDYIPLYTVAMHPLLWEKTRNPDGWMTSQFVRWFAEARENPGTLVIRDVSTADVYGSTRFYDYKENEKSVAIGHTFVVRTHWELGINQEIKHLMLDYAFRYVDTVWFYPMVGNDRAQRTLKKLGAQFQHQLVRDYRPCDAYCLLKENYHAAL